MPSRRALKRYPAWYFSLITQAQKNIVHLRVSNPNQLRKNLYNFRSAVRLQYKEEPENDALALLLQRAERLSFSIRPGVVEVYPTDVDPVDLDLVPLRSQSP